MNKARVYSYEAMFLISQSAAADFGGAIEHIRSILGRAGAQIVAMRKWDERRLAYEIDKQKRGTYILAFFSADSSKLAQIERDCNLSETVMRTLITRADHLTLEEMQAADDQRGLEAEAALRRSRAETPAGGGSAAPAAAAEPMAEPAGVSPE
ncbi:MAG: 30S ribosomal protein S6 [Planctomycetota bacterium]|nr:30S ribosomal protein S6 [Planctomycetota bacterium]